MCCIDALHAQQAFAATALWSNGMALAAKRLVCLPNAVRIRLLFACLQDRKVYVQDRLAEQAALVWRLLEEGAHFYVCGDAGAMAGAVERQLLAVIEGGQRQGPAAAAAYLARLAERGRYQRDVWLA